MTRNEIGWRPFTCASIIFGISGADCLVTTVFSMVHCLWMLAVYVLRCVCLCYVWFLICPLHLSLSSSACSKCYSNSGNLWFRICRYFVVVSVCESVSCVTFSDNVGWPNQSEIIWPMFSSSLIPLSIPFYSKLEHCAFTLWYSLQFYTLIYVYFSSLFFMFQFIQYTVNRHFLFISSVCTCVYCI